ncbi:MAG: hypothetical protein KIS67_20505, partial [Verrucomicrobiae bacterium]|nr:hypothetical protein [Verrucomicrobiae bacterium]
SSSSADRRFVWGIRSVDDLILRDDTSQRLYALSDAMGSVTAVVNTGGTVQERYGYDGFGTPRYMTAAFAYRDSSSYDWETLFDGYRYDLPSGLYQVRYRFLHPSLGRWLNRDPIANKGFKLWGLYLGEAFSELRGTRSTWTRVHSNLYDYATNDPLLLYDRLGLDIGVGRGILSCISDCSQACEVAKKRGLDAGDAGGLVCCNGQLYACVWDTSGATGASHSKAREIIGRCIQAHEEDHLPFSFCSSLQTGLNRPRAPLFGRRQAECSAYLTEALCLMNGLADCGGDVQCLAEVRTELAHVRGQIEEYCGRR